MKGKIFAIIFFLYFTSFLILNAQWGRTYGTSEDEHAYFIKHTNDGGYIVAGKTGDYLYKNGHSVPPGQDVWVIKLSPDGEIEWQKILGGNGTDEVQFIQQTNDGGYILGGLIAATGNNRFAIIKLFPNGDIEWQKGYGDSSMMAYSFQQTSNGGYIVAGKIWPPETGQTEFLVLKLFFDGTVEWSKTYGGSIDDQSNSIQQTGDGGYIVAGETESFGAGNKDIWILKLDSEGMIEWQKTYGGSQNEEAFSIKQTIDGGYIVGVQTNSFGAGQMDFWILKLSSEGDFEWNKIYGGSKNDNAYSFQQTFDGGYIVAGETQSFGAGNKDFWILKLNILGDLEWQKTYGGSQNEEASFIQQTNDGGYIVAGSTDSYGAGSRDFLILKLFSNGDIASSCGFINDSNAEVFDADIDLADTHVNPEYPDIHYRDKDITSRNSEALVYSLCSGQHTLSLTTSLRGTTDPQPGTYIYDHAALIHIKTIPDEEYVFIGWSGDVISTDSSLNITMDSDKSLRANFGENVLEEIWEEVKKAPCFIATAAFGSPLHPYVKTLQEFRDKYLKFSRAGRKLVKLYYKYSPHIAEIITNHKGLKTVVRFWLVPFVAMGYSMVHFGPVKTTMMFLLSIMPLFIFVWFYRRKNKQLEN